LVLGGSLPLSVGHHEWLEVGTQTSFDGWPILLLSARLRPLVPTHEYPSHFWVPWAALKPSGPTLRPSALPLLEGPHTAVQLGYMIGRWIRR
jgi:hypothetical protein